MGISLIESPTHLPIKHLQDVLCGVRIVEGDDVVFRGMIAENVDAAIPDVGFVHDAAIEVDVRL